MVTTEEAVTVVDLGPAEALEVHPAAPGEEEDRSIRSTSSSGSI